MPEDDVISNEVEKELTEDEIKTMLCEMKSIDIQIDDLKIRKDKIQEKIETYLSSKSLDKYSNNLYSIYYTYPSETKKIDEKSFMAKDLKLYAEIIDKYGKVSNKSGNWTFKRKSK